MGGTRDGTMTAMRKDPTYAPRWKRCVPDMDTNLTRYIHPLRVGGVCVNMPIGILMSMHRTIEHYKHYARESVPFLLCAHSPMLYGAAGWRSVRSQLWNALVEKNVRFDVAERRVDEAVHSGKKRKKHPGCLRCPRVTTCRDFS